jgi:flagellar motor switch/type III secretory pathway protein FliN
MTDDRYDDAATTLLEESDAGATTLLQDQPASATQAGGSDPVLDQLELPIEVRLGELEWRLERVLELRVGDSVPIGPDGDDTVTLYVQGRPFATGELVVVEGRFAFRVRELAAGRRG